MWFLLLDGESSDIHPIPHFLINIFVREFQVQIPLNGHVLEKLSTVPVCRRDLSTSGAIPTLQFIMPATPVNRNSRTIFHLSYSNLFSFLHMGIQ